MKQQKFVQMEKEFVKMKINVNVIKDILEFNAKMKLNVLVFQILIKIKFVQVEVNVFQIIFVNVIQMIILILIVQILNVFKFQKMNQM